jgi:hypothetical protein
MGPLTGTSNCGLRAQHDKTSTVSVTKQLQQASPHASNSQYCSYALPPAVALITRSVCSEPSAAPVTTPPSQTTRLSSAST